MHFDSLKDKCEYFRSLTDYKLTPNSYAIIMLDGHCFSKLIKNKYKKPFDPEFMSMMDETARHLLKHIQGAKLAYVQSDEISILVTDFDTPETDSPFGYRVCKLQSILAGMAANEFNGHAIRNAAYDWPSHEPMNVFQLLDSVKPVEFDCKVWNVPDYNEAFCHFLWRQNDCTRNSKQAAAQAQFSSKELHGLKTDAQVEKLFNEKGINWNDYSNGEKYGRIIYKEDVPMLCANGQVVDRSLWVVHEATPFADEDNVIRTLIPRRNG